MEVVLNSSGNFFIKMGKKMVTNLPPNPNAQVGSDRVFYLGLATFSATALTAVVGCGVYYETKQNNELNREQKDYQYVKDGFISWDEFRARYKR